MLTCFLSEQLQCLRVARESSGGSWRSESAVALKKQVIEYFHGTRCRGEGGPRTRCARGSNRGNVSAYRRCYASVVNGDSAIREFDIASGWHVQGALSCAHWLAWRVGWDLRTARERVRVARKLAELPLIDEELRIGAMSCSQARAISRVATAENEKLWVGYAKHMPASQLDTLCRSYQNVQAYDQAHESETGAMAGAGVAAQVAAQRTVTRRTLDNGMVKFEIVVASDEAAIVWAALNAGIAKAGAAPTPADSSLVEPSPAEPPRADQTPAEPRSAEPSPAKPSIAARYTTNRESPNVGRPWPAACRCVHGYHPRSCARWPTSAYADRNHHHRSACRLARFSGTVGSRHDGRWRRHRNGNSAQVMLRRWRGGRPRRCARRAAICWS